VTTSFALRTSALPTEKYRRTTRTLHYSFFDLARRYRKPPDLSYGDQNLPSSTKLSSRPTTATTTTHRNGFLPTESSPQLSDKTTTGSLQVTHRRLSGQGYGLRYRRALPLLPRGASRAGSGVYEYGEAAVDCEVRVGGNQLSATSTAHRSATESECSTRKE
jgi:hypothetical protein